jgi:hypothetical protein
MFAFWRVSTLYFARAGKHNIIIFMTGIILFIIGFGICFLGLSTKDEIHRISALAAGIIALVWGFALSPLSFQLFIETISVLAAFLLCMRCLGCGSSQ